MDGWSHFFSELDDVSQIPIAGGANLQLSFDWLKQRLHVNYRVQSAHAMVHMFGPNLNVPHSVLDTVF